jgi:hypothetical protein
MSENSIKITDNVTINPNRGIYCIIVDDAVIMYCKNRITAETIIQTISSTLETTLKEKNIQIFKNVSPMEHKKGIITLSTENSILNFFSRFTILHTITYQMLYEGSVDLPIQTKYEEITNVTVPNVDNHDSDIDNNNNQLSNREINNCEKDMKISKSYNKIIKKQLNWLKNYNKQIETDFNDYDSDYDI